MLKIIAQSCIQIFTKFSDLARIEADDAEIWHTRPVFYAEQEYTNEKYNCARFLLKKNQKVVQVLEARWHPFAAPKACRFYAIFH